MKSAVYTIDDGNEFWCPECRSTARRTRANPMPAVEHKPGCSAAPDKWTKIELPVCDLCARRAVWRHPDGGLRCGSCPKPCRRR